MSSKQLQDVEIQDKSSSAENQSSTAAAQQNREPRGKGEITHGRDTAT